MQRFSIFCAPGLVMTTILMAAGFTAIPAHAVEQTGQAAITEGEVNAAQQAWCDGLLKIGKIARNGGDHTRCAGYSQRGCRHLRRATGIASAGGGDGSRGGRSGSDSADRDQTGARYRYGATRGGGSAIDEVRIVVADLHREAISRRSRRTKGRGVRWILTFEGANVGCGG